MPDGDFFGDFGDPYDPYAEIPEGTGYDYNWRWVQNGKTFHFVGPFGLEKWDDGGVSYSTPESESPGVSNTYQEDSYLRPRDITLTGQVIADNPTALRAAFDVLAGAFPEGSVGQMYRSSDRYINARVALFRESEPDEGFNDRKWTLGLRCADPFYYSATNETPVSLSVSGTGSTTSLTPGGSAHTLPLINLTVPGGGVGKSITLSSPGNAETCVFVPPSAGTYHLNSALGTITKTGVTDGDYLYCLTGDLLALDYRATTLTLTLQEAGILTTATVQWTRRWRSG